ncbi:hypothetical protein [Chryseobacterium sp. Mn2064]|uniref:hypothetical protein n=1 Tax=Chryseobacterium sp. Mn2064 TaxID=3395263 RepID=UPI003BBC960D
MKNLNITKRKLSKSELKKINGGNAPICVRGFCMVPGSDDLFRGHVGPDGYCC